MNRTINNTTGIFLLPLFAVLIAGCTFEFNIEELRKKSAIPDVYVYYTVTFESNGGSYVEPQTVISGGKAAEPQGVSNTGYTFYGWYTDNDAFDDKWDFNSAVTKDITLHAKWVFEGKVVPGSFIVTFDKKNTEPGSTEANPQVKVQRCHAQFSTDI
jgi:uncharacterized repeat protein (TIGR02543 family)